MTDVNRQWTGREVGQLPPLTSCELAKRFPWIDPAPPAPDDELRHVHPAAADLAPMHPPLAFSDPLRQFALGQPGPLPQLAQKRRHVPVNRGLIPLRRHTRLISSPRADAL